MWLALISDGHLYHHCGKDFTFQRTWGFQTHTFCHFSDCLVRAMLPLPLCSGLGKNYSFSTSDLYNPLPEHKGWETCGGNLYFLPQFTNRPHPLPFEHKAVSLSVCRMKQMSSTWQVTQLSKAVIYSIPFPLTWPLDSLGNNAMIEGGLHLLLNQ